MSQRKVEFEKVTDKRGKRMRGLWQRGSVFYVQLRVTNPKTGKRRPQKLALDKEITTVPQAVQAQAELKPRSDQENFAAGLESQRSVIIGLTTLNALKSTSTLSIMKRAF